ncbi:MAG: CerR family C-terminal domain-containing protein [Proteobacteria bacterium]|nr:CerR family C-terminal domain-containing protein [Burkholderiales bacterium]
MVDPTVASRADGAQAREKLLHAALRLFAEKGFERTSTREIAQAAGANVSAIGYYFGDKAGLYRIAFLEPLGDLCPRGQEFEIDGIALPVLMQRFFAEFLEPLKRGEEVRLVMRLHFREMVEPTGVWADEIENEIKPQHAALIRVLSREFDLQRSDSDLQRLAFAIVGMAVHFFVGQEIVNEIAPELLAGPEAIDALAERLAGFSLAMIEAERARRGARAAERQPDVDE